ncbi:serine protease [Puniceibacterium sp. IMCC21224]|uniref:trypsin-like serine peptidase n=1 Tax=Puniceibacterium sp. IMCC21224 TaxID=1618204 RepID=UPI00064D9F27|nr:trypsin-like peptidase domain-containing protein [Puniceibacterium sp. IMCC21224]KMK68468.1 Trypsin-like peptidase domain [Puniceibacterium sp. IMCC21224]
MGEVSRTQIGRIASGLKVSRDVFARAYDDVAFAYGGDEFKVVAQIANAAKPLPAGADRDRRDFRAAMVAANESDWLADFIFEKFADLAAASHVAIRPELQSIAQRKQRFQDAAVISSGSLAAMRRGCMVLSRTTLRDGTIEDTPLGSGFLIGPHLILTNYHVVRSFLNPDGTPLKDGPQPAVAFDIHHGPRRIVEPRSYRVMTDGIGWLLGKSMSLPEDQAESQAALLQHLDYAILRLDGRPGDARGWYDLARVPDLPDFDTPMQVWQFPRGQPMKSVTNNRARPPDALAFPDAGGGQNHARVYYFANALDGSSGGLVLRDSMEPVALHDAGFHPEAPAGARVNRGVPLRRIADDALTMINQDIESMPRRVGWHVRRNLPILGRHQLQDMISRAALGPVRILTVLTRPDAQMRRLSRIGRSYTREILESCLPPDRHHVVVIEASLIDPDPFLTASRIVSAIDPERVAGLPGASGETTLDADAAGLLLDRTVDALKEAAPGKVVWLMIDDIDAHEIGTQWPSSSFLVSLYLRVAREPRLRVVLVGLPKRLDALMGLGSAVLMEEDLQAAPAPADLRDWLEAHLTKGMPPDEFAPRLSVMLNSLAGHAAGNTVTPSAPTPTADGHGVIEALNELLSVHALGAFRSRRGSAGGIEGGST